MGGTINADVSQGTTIFNGEGPGHLWWFKGVSNTVQIDGPITGLPGNNLSFTAPNGTASGVNGSGFSFTTGNGGGGTSSGGPFTINLGTGTGSGSNGTFKVVVPSDSSTAWHTVNTPLIVNQFGLGVGTTPFHGVAMAYDVTYTDPVLTSGQSVKGFDGIMSITLTANNATQPQGMNPSVYLNDGGFNLTGSLIAMDMESHVKSGSSGTHADIECLIPIAMLDSGSSANATVIRALAPEVNIAGSGTATTATTVYGQLYLNPSGGLVDGNITEGNVFSANIVNQSSAATPGVITLARGFYAPTAFVSNSGSITTIVGMESGPFNCTPSSTSTSGGWTTYAYKATVGTQGGNTSGTNNNYGYQVSWGNASPGSGGTVNNYGLAVAACTTQATNIYGIQVLRQGSAAGALGGDNVYGIQVELARAGGQATGTVTNYALYVKATASGGSPGSGGNGRVDNYGILVEMPSATAPSGTTSNAFGLRITGSPANTATTNFFAIRSDSTSNSVIAGPLTLGSTSNPTATSLTLADAWNIVVGTTTGTQIGTGTTQKIGFYGVTPVAQPAASADTHTVTAGSTTNVFTNTTFDGSTGSSAYTVGGIVARLKALGILAA